MNIPKLKAKMVEKEMSVAILADKMNIDRSTLYRKLNEGEKFTIGEAQQIKGILKLNEKEASAIFFAQ